MHSTLTDPIPEIAKLAQSKGCTLRAIATEESLLYWVENHYFIGKPYVCLAELTQFIQRLPLAT
ncbi:MAG: hypothetical protein HC772_02790 [Leptolyngbyaceae cyanobacterium CRU_2_3]|nr:hypothetical protein [Leptolyngbyaceae cyanobacterium CRU_2_3]